MDLKDARCHHIIIPDRNDITLTKSALALLKWAIDELSRGRIIVSINQNFTDLCYLSLDKE